MTEPNKYISTKEAIKKLENYCAYQDRCHNEVITKLYNLNIPSNEHDEIIVYLIENKFLNEERFARNFARGKHRISAWGKNRIISELKLRKISSTLIKLALKEITDDLYYETFERISNLKWESLKDTDIEKKKAKLHAYLYRKGYESDIIYDKIKELSK
ncbi:MULTISPECIES: regulatory protein RecX [Myroides]|uniref:Regulatory protein RecX n=1 Tax=Myroides albus TaxID=2562892 RepID=A0A6I3LN32_9FLAO|nr:MULTISPECIES: regulatory protein RecX [Myroides]MTG97582.1 recombinase RecX [Myroides albus]MVX36854.1 recombinase RecX [Myroides sp. LoEW2-1]UVD81143.1 RecX family transcriptional regulator [Myroides albus]